MGYFDGECISENKLQEDQSDFWSNGSLHWDAHRIGWAIAGGCACLTTIITFFSVAQHCRSYTNRIEQRQIIRILYMPPVYAIISFFSYRFFRSYTYYSFVEVAYEAVTLSAFLLLLIEYVASTAANHDAENAISRKDKRKLPIPFCCWRYRPTKAYFMYTLKWSVLQYVIIRPLASIAGIVCEKLGVLCESAGYNPRYAALYIEIVDFISISIALYGLLIFYGLTAAELQGRRPLAKFLCIKLIVMFTFYQSFVFSWLEGVVIHETDFWTEANIANGLNALAICIEMVGFSIMFWWAYPAKEYVVPGAPKTSIWRPLWDSINYSDFVMEIAGSFRFFIDYFKGKPTAHGHGHWDRKNLRTDENGNPRPTFGQAFGVEGSKSAHTDSQVHSPTRTTHSTHHYQKTSTIGSPTPHYPHAQDGSGRYSEGDGGAYPRSSPQPQGSAGDAEREAGAAGRAGVGLRRVDYNQPRDDSSLGVGQPF